MAAYYNEIDKQKAVWLRELIARNLIAPGDVDERSIVDVRPDDLRGYAQCHFFAGIGIWSYALRLAAWPDDREVWSGSCPCQPFSAAGKGEAFNDERHLWPEYFRLIEARRPVVCFGEQVASIDGLAWLDLVQADLDDAGYTCGAVDLCAAGFGAPHRRQRLYWVAYKSGTRLERNAGALIQRVESGFTSSGDAGGVADASSERRQQDARGSSPHESKDGGTGWHERKQDCNHKPSGNGSISRMENPMRAERWPDQREPNGYRETPGRDESADQQRERSETERLEHAESRGQFGRWIYHDAGAQDARGNEAERSDDREHPSSRSTGGEVPGPVNGFWRDADWVLTRPQRVGDRPGLRPVERGAFPLAHGTPQRVGRLRGYGDGIVAQAAEAFIRAYLETSNGH